MSLEQAERFFLREHPGADDLVADAAHRPMVWVRHERRWLWGIVATLAVLSILGVTLWWVYEPAIALVLWKLGPTFDRSPAPVSSTTLWVAAIAAIVACWVAVWAILPARRVRFYRDAKRADLLMELRQDGRGQLLTHTYTLVDPADVPIARLRHNRLLGLLVQDRWTATSPDNDTPICRAIERPIYLGPLRRLLGPMWALLRTDLAIETDATPAGLLTRRRPEHGRRPLDIAATSIDPRVVTAIAVMANRDE